MTHRHRSALLGIAVAIVGITASATSRAQSVSTTPGGTTMGTATSTTGTTTTTPTTDGTTPVATTPGTTTTGGATGGAVVPIAPQAFEVNQSVAPGTTPTTTFTVPAGAAMLVTDLLVTNPGATPVCGATIARSGTPVVGPLCVPATTTLVVTLTTGIPFGDGQTVDLINDTTTSGASPLTFTLRGIM